MKRCAKCDVVFNLDERTRCLYCNSLLLYADSAEQKNLDDLDALRGFSAEDTVLESVIRDRRKVAGDHRFYVIGSYFCTRTLHFIYAFSRNEMKMGRIFKRRLIQPLNMGSFLIIPWVLWDLIDSFFFHLVYNSYCLKCGWKYHSSGKKEHDAAECEYNQEYAEIIRDILSGRIIQNEGRYREAALIKEAVGKRSAYRYLCGPRNFLSSIVDVACVWFSILLMIVFFVAVVFPSFSVLFHKMEDIQTLELR